MQLTDLLCYALLTIAVTTTYVCAEEEKQKETRLEENKPRGISKRDASLLIDNFPIEPSYNQRPKVIFRRLSRTKNGLPKPKYEPYKAKYGPPPSKKNPAKKFRKQMNYKYGQRHKQRSPKPRYGLPKRPLKKPVRPAKKIPPSYNTEPAGFAEPPVDIEVKPLPYQYQNYAEPPVDSYGAPLKAPHGQYPPLQNYEETQNQYEQSDFSNLAQEFNPRQHSDTRNHGSQWESDGDNYLAYSKKRPLFVKPDELFDAKVDGNEENFSDLYNIHSYKEPQYLNYRKKRPQFFVDSNKKVKTHWKAPKYKQEKFRENDNDILLVGGQYAEPPARYVPKFQPSAPMFTSSDEFSPAIKSYGEFQAPTTSATISPYVNYINSNMAFNPQNLNDVFSSR